MTLLENINNLKTFLVTLQLDEGVVLSVGFDKCRGYKPRVHVMPEDFERIANECECDIYISKYCSTINSSLYILVFDSFEVISYK
jgi:hypothetical protein